MNHFVTNLKINNDYQKLIADIESAGGEISDYQINELESIESKKTDLMVSIGAEILELNAVLDAKKNFLTQFKETISEVESKIESREKFLLKNYTEKIESENLTISIQESKSVSILDMDSLDEKYKKTKTEISPDKVLIKKDLKNGIDVSGAELQTNKNLRVKIR